MKRRAVITGITGQDGSYLADLLLGKGYEVHGIVRHASMADRAKLEGKISHLLSDVTLHSACIENRGEISSIIEAVRPDECYHLAGVSVMSYSVEEEFSTLQTNINSTHHLLSAIRENVPTCRFFFAGSSELYGKVEVSPQDERTPFRPRGPYGIAKQASFEIVRLYRESHGIYGGTGILYNHESPRRGLNFVTRKISRHAAMIKLGLAQSLALGNLDSHRDWGHARDVVRAMWLMLQQERGDDYVLSSGRLHTVGDFCRVAFEHVGLDYREYVTLDPRFNRPPEKAVLLGCNDKARRELGWEPEIDFEQLVREMVDYDLADLRKPALA